MRRAPKSFSLKNRERFFVTQFDEHAMFSFLNRMKINMKRFASKSYSLLIIFFRKSFDLSLGDALYQKKKEKMNRFFFSRKKSNMFHYFLQKSGNKKNHTLAVFFKDESVNFMQ